MARVFIVDWGDIKIVDSNPWMGNFLNVIEIYLHRLNSELLDEHLGT